MIMIMMMNLLSCLGGGHFFSAAAPGDLCSFADAFACPRPFRGAVLCYAMLCLAMAHTRVYIPFPRTSAALFCVACTASDLCSKNVLHIFRELSFFVFVFGSH